MEFLKPDNFDDAVTMAKDAQGNVRFLAGGTDVLVQMRADILTPDTLIDLKNIEATRSITRSGDGWEIGATVSGAEMSEHPELGSEWPGVVEAMDLIGSTQVQGRATLTGNLCNGSPAADSVPALIAAGATANIIGPNGARSAAVEDIPTDPGRTSLEEGELITSLSLPPRGDKGGDAYLRFIPRTEMDIAVAGCAVSLTLDGDKVASARVSIGAVAPTALLVSDAAAAIIGTSLDDEALEAMAARVSAACNPISDKRGTVKFRTHVAGVLAKRAAKIAYDRAKA